MLTIYCGKSLTGIRISHGNTLGNATCQELLAYFQQCQKKIQALSHIQVAKYLGLQYVLSKQVVHQWDLATSPLHGR